MTKSLVAITGASSTIGAELTRVFSEAGYPLGLIARNREAIQKLNLPHSVRQSVDITDRIERRKVI